MSFSTTTQSSAGSDLAHRAPTSDVRTWYDDLNSPLIQEHGNTKSLKLRFDVSQYAPEEIVVKTVDNKLLVSKEMRLLKKDKIFLKNISVYDLYFCFNTDHLTCLIFVLGITIIYYISSLV